MKKQHVSLVLAWLVILLLLAACTTPPLAVLPGGSCPQPSKGSQLLTNEDHGYCVLYPATHQVEKPNVEETVLVVDSLMNVTDPSLYIQVTDAAGRTAVQAADAVQADVESAMPGVTVERSAVTLGGQTGVMLDKLPGQDFNRRVFVVHDGRLYDLMFMPADPSLGEAYQGMLGMYDQAVRSFTFLP